jgi:hypothetical protein
MNREERRLNGEEGGAANKVSRGKNGGFVPVYVSFSLPVGWVTFFHSLGRENRKYTPDQKHRSTREPTIHRQSGHQTLGIRGLLLNKPTEICISLNIKKYTGLGDFSNFRPLFHSLLFTIQSWFAQIGS